MNKVRSVWTGAMLVPGTISLLGLGCFMDEVRHYEFDDLSGALFSARRRVTTVSPREARAIAQALVLRAREVVASSPRELDAGAMRDALEWSSQLLGVQASVRVRTREDADRSELRDALEIASELIGNAAKHGCAWIDLEIDLREARVTGRTPPRGKWRPPGRGLRNLELRAQVRGGALTIDRLGTDVVVQARWPTVLVEDTRWWRGRPFLLQLAALGATTPLFFHGHPLGGIVITVVACVFAATLSRQRELVVLARRSELAVAVEARRKSEQAETIVTVARACEGPLEALTVASKIGTNEEIREAIVQLAGRVTDVLHDLESPKVDSHVRAMVGIDERS